MRYRSRRDDDGDLRSRLRELAQQRRRFGYRRLHILLRRDGILINRKKTQRLYREEGLTVRRRRGRRRAVGARAPAPVLALPNQRWSLDFVHDQLATGRRFRVLNIVDDVTRECLRAVVDTSISGRRVVRELADLIAERGAPKMIVSDNGTELTSDAVLAWAGDVGVEWHYIAPGKPTQNGFVESFTCAHARQLWPVSGCRWMKAGGHVTGHRAGNRLRNRKAHIVVAERRHRRDAVLADHRQASGGVMLVREIDAIGEGQARPPAARVILVGKRPALAPHAVTRSPVTQPLPD